MSLQVFISYSGHDDQVIAFRLQTLASVYGFRAFVPPATTRLGSGQLASSVTEEIKRADVILAVVNNVPSPATITEINSALSLRKLVIPIVGQWVDRTFLNSFQRYFVLDPQDPAKIEQEITAFLHQSHTTKATQQLIVGLAAVAVGLLLLSAVSD